MADQLSIYNGALLHCKERFLASLTEEREPRRLLDHVWANGGVKECLEEGQWHFAMRTAQIDYDPDLEPDFGYRRAFVKPTDWLRTSALCQDEFFNAPLTQYTDEAGYWYADLDTIFVRYVSDDADYGQDMNKWPQAFRAFVEVHFASRIVGKLSGSEDKEQAMLKKREEFLHAARGGSASSSPTRFPAPGAWAGARMTGWARNRGPRGPVGT